MQEKKQVNHDNKLKRDAIREFIRHDLQVTREEIRAETERYVQKSVEAHINRMTKEGIMKKITKGIIEDLIQETPVANGNNNTMTRRNRISNMIENEAKRQIHELITTRLFVAAPIGEQHGSEKT